MQVEEKQIWQDVQGTMLTQLECEYMIDKLKKEKVDDGKHFSWKECSQIYLNGLNTLQALMFLLRLNKEWHLVTK